MATTNAIGALNVRGTLTKELAIARMFNAGRKNPRTPPTANDLRQTAVVMIATGCLLATAASIVAAANW
jgi:hypothetical protein